MDVIIKINELETRIGNIEIAIEILKQELLMLLQEKKELSEYKQVGFIYKK